MQTINIQPIEKQSLREDGNIELNSLFYTIQGEGIFAGRPAVFVRLAGCNLQCPQCDTEYTERTLVTPRYIVEEVKKATKHVVESSTSYNRMLVVITGGEPFRQNLKPLTDLLIKNNYTVQIETNGTLYQELHQSVFIVCSPKTGSIHPKMKERANAFKYVLDHDKLDVDGLPLITLGHPNSGTVYKAQNEFVDVFVQPADNKDPVINKLNLEAAKESAMKFNRILCIQIHKEIGVE